MKVGYARVSTRHQDLAVQRQALAQLGVPADRVYVDHGLTGTNRQRPGLEQATAACRAGDEFVVTKLDRLARSVPDAHEIMAELHTAGVRLNIGGSIHDPDDPVGKLLLNVLAMVAEFESDLIRQRTREGLAVAKDKGRLKGKPRKLKPAQERHLVKAYETGDHSATELAELFNLSRATVYRTLARCRSAPPTGGAKS